VLDQLEPRDLVGGIHAVPERIAQRRREAISALPHVELLAAEPGDAHDLANVQRACRLASGNSRRRIRRHSGCILAPRRRLDEDSHCLLPLTFSF